MVVFSLRSGIREELDGDTESSRRYRAIALFLRTLWEHPLRTSDGGRDDLPNQTYLSLTMVQPVRLMDGV